MGVAVATGGGAMEQQQKPEDGEEDPFTKTPRPLSRSPGNSPSIRNMTKTVIVSLAETVTHDITYGESMMIRFWLDKNSN